MRFSKNYNHNSDHFDLLPFIAILMCLLGALLLITMGMTAINLGPGANEGWTVISDSLANKTPVLIEWDGDNAIIHQADSVKNAKWTASTQKIFNKKGKLIQISDSLSLDPVLWTAIQDLQHNRNSKFVLFAVRPSGFHNFTLFAEEFRNRDIEIAKEPIEQNKKVRIRNSGQ